MKNLITRGLLSLLVAIALPTAARGATWVVDDPADPLPIVGTLTLRQAIQNANAAPGPHHIMFQLPFPGTPMIQPVTELPALVVDNIWIDGFSQPGASPGGSPPTTATLQIQIDGSLAGWSHGLVIFSSFNRVEGLAIMNFQRDGIRIQGTPEPGTRSNVLYANFVGTESTGRLFAGNGSVPGGNVWAGIDIVTPPSEFVLLCTDNRVERNLVSGNFRCGIQICSCPPSDCWANQVLNNLIGTDITGMRTLGNLGSGVVLAEGTHDNIITNNVISANGANGIDITGNYFTTPPTSTDRNRASNNLIGLGSDGVLPLGNGGRGVSLGIFENASFYAGYCNGNMFTQNKIAHNGRSGVTVWEHPQSSSNADLNTLLRNAIHQNGALGIDLGDDGVTFNDPGDFDSGPDQQLNFPAILTATIVSGVTTVTGFVENQNEVHLYRARLDPSGYGEGDLWLASTRPNPLGSWSLSVSGLTAQDYVTALAMDWAVPPYSNTSEFCQAIQVVDPTAAVGEGARSAERPALFVSGPNPFRIGTAFRCVLPGAVSATLAIHDISGRLVRLLPLACGTSRVNWDGTDAGGLPVPTGVYFVSLDRGGERISRRVMRLR